MYYVDDGESSPEAEGTALQLFDPNPARTNIFFPELSASNLSFKPLPGLMVLFPSYVLRMRCRRTRARAHAFPWPSTCAGTRFPKDS